MRRDTKNNEKYIEDLIIINEKTSQSDSSEKLSDQSNNLYTSNTAKNQQVNEQTAKNHKINELTENDQNQNQHKQNQSVNENDESEPTKINSCKNEIFSDYLDDCEFYLNTNDKQSIIIASNTNIDQIGPQNVHLIDESKEKDKKLQIQSTFSYSHDELFDVDFDFGKLEEHLHKMPCNSNPDRNIFANQSYCYHKFYAIIIIIMFVI